MARIVLFGIVGESAVFSLASLAIELEKRGHSVVVVGTRERCDQIAHLRLSVEVLCGDASEFELSSGRDVSPADRASHLSESFRRRAAQWVEAGARACKHADCVLGVGGSALYFAKSLAESVGAKFIQIMLSPYLLMLPRAELAKLLRGFWEMQAASLNEIARPQLGLPPYPSDGPHRSLQEAETPLLAAYSPLIGPPISTLPPNVRVTGFWNSFRHDSAVSTAELSEFMDRSTKVAHVDFGQVEVLGSLEMVIAELRRKGFAVILTPPKVAEGHDAFAAQDVCISEALPHALASRIEFSVHRGGTDNCASVLGAGLPSIVVPMKGDEFFWANLLSSLELAPPPLRTGAFTPDEFDHAVSAASSLRMRTISNSWGDYLANENGTQTAAAAIERWLGRPIRRIGQRLQRAAL